MKYIFQFTVLFLYTAYTFSQTKLRSTEKPPIDHNVYGEWPRVGGAQLSDDGRYVMYTTGVYGKALTLTIQSLEGGWKQVIEGVDSYQFVSGVQLAVVQAGGLLKLVYPGRLDQEQAIKVSSWKMPRGGKKGWLAYQPDSSKNLLLRNLTTDSVQELGPVENYIFNDNGETLLYETGSQKLHKLHWLDLANNNDRVIWEGAGAQGYVFSATGAQLAFVAPVEKNNIKQYVLWYYTKNVAQAEQWVSPGSRSIAAGLRIAADGLRFSNNGKWIYFKLDNSPAGSKEAFFASLSESELGKWTRELVFNPNLQPWLKLQPRPDAVQMNVWSYFDPPAQPMQVRDAVVSTTPKQPVIMLTGADEEQESIISEKGDYVLIKRQREYSVAMEWKWNSAGHATIYLIALKDGRRQLLKDGLEGSSGIFWLSPNGRFVLYGDPERRRYASYETATGTWRNLLLSPDLDCSRGDQERPQYKYAIANVETWLEDDHAVLLRDRQDIFKMDLLGQRPMINITRGYGRRQNISLRFMRPTEGAWGLANQNLAMAPEGGYWLTSFNKKTKAIGFYHISKLSGEEPRLISEEGYAYEREMDLAPLRARDAQVYVVSRETTAESPNYFWTKDFKNFHRISNNRPEQDYNWMRSELMRWKTFDGTMAEGVLYKPENFDPGRKYPIVFDFYEEQSEFLHQYLSPEFGGATLPIPWLVSNGYLVFRPDIHYKIGTPGKSAYDHVVSAAQYLTSFPWVNAKRMAIQGASWGGYEVNYIVTHTKIFTAAYSGCGISNLVSLYGAGTAASIMDIESGQMRIGTTLWQHPEYFIKGSPVFFVDRVSTPILLMHNKADGAVPYDQGLQFFKLLRRLGKKVWMLEYDQGGHTVTEKDMPDLNVRIEQFFNHYLKDAPPPQWMTEGIPVWRKGIDTGLAPDMSGKKP
jgi:dipeptidyl aminopeptidase/acylaminoacyl peptidase